MPTEDVPRFTHRPLSDPSNQIRLLKVPSRPSNESPFAANGQDSLHFDMKAWKIDGAPPYYAISYTWGPPAPLASILLNSELLQVRSNCHCALWQSSLHYAEDYIWIDSVCIDQENFAEKSAQVRLMATIYGKADATISSLGAEFEGSDKVIDSIASFRQESGDWGGAVDHSSEAGAKFIHQPYWSRLWIVQELRLAKRVDIMCGSRHAGDVGETLGKDANVYVYPSLGSMFTEPEIPYTRMASSIGGSTDGDLKFVIAQLAEFECTDIRDRVYAAFGICSKDPLVPKITVDYSKSAVQLAAGVVELEDSVPDFAHMLGTLLRALRINGDDKDLLEHRLQRQRRKQSDEDIAILAAEVARNGTPLPRTLSGRIVSGVYDGQRLLLSPSGKGRLAVENLYCEQQLTTGYDQSVPEMLPWTPSRFSARSFSSSEKVEAAAHAPLTSSAPCFAPASGLQPIWHDGEIVGAITDEAQSGDVVVQFHGGNTVDVYPSNTSRLLVVRHSQYGGIYEIIGQGILLPSLGLRREEYVKGEGGEEVNLEEQREDRHDPLPQKFRFAMGGDDLFLLLTKYYYEDLEGNLEGSAHGGTSYGERFERAVEGLKGEVTVGRWSSFAMKDSAVDD